MMAQAGCQGKTKQNKAEQSKKQNRKEQKESTYVTARMCIKHLWKGGWLLLERRPVWRGRGEKETSLGALWYCLTLELYKYIIDSKQKNNVNPHLRGYLLMVGGGGRERNNSVREKH